jgi:AraC-like DNA-binding protein
MAAKTKPTEETRTLHVKNMTSTCCIHLLRIVLVMDGLEISELKLGKLVLTINPTKISWVKIETILEGYGFEIIRNREKILVEQIKMAMIDLVQNSTFNAMVRNSDFLVERFGMSYPYISALFSKHEDSTLEKFTIMLKIDKVKELIRYGELTLSEIAYMMGYSSVQYLSTQFKSITGISVTDFKLNPFVEDPGAETS